MNKQIGITTTVPIEVVFAAGLKPVDLNNLFIGSPDYSHYIDLAERKGFPKSLCSWIKGIYGAAIANHIEQIVGVVEGDCSNTASLGAVLESEGIKVIPFGYPHDRSKKLLGEYIRQFSQSFSVSPAQVETQRKYLNEIRAMAHEVDRLSWQEGTISGLESHIAQVSLSDFYGGEPETARDELTQLLEQAKERSPRSHQLRLGYIGVPPMTVDLYESVESMEADIVYNEIQREFTFPRCFLAHNIVEQYLDYTYPYSIHFRLDEIKKQIKERKLDALIHYTQSFCHRALDDIIIRQEAGIPVLTIEGDRSNSLDARTKLRLEAFLDMMADAGLRGVRF